MMPFLNYWYLQSWQRFYAGCRAGLGSVENEVAVIDTARNINQPLFQDYTRQGRILGILFRIVRIFAGIVAFGLVIIGYILLYLFWLCFPALCLITLVGAFLGISA